MKHLKYLLVALGLLFATQADAASRFWVGGTGTWDSTTTTHWSASTGGASGASAPVNGDSITFDGSSGGGTVTVDTTINGLSFAGLTFGAFTGTLDFSVNNPSTTWTNDFNISGSGTRTLKLGSGTFTLTPSGGNNTAWFAQVTTGLTLIAGTSTISLTGTTAVNVTAFSGGGLTYHNLTINGGSSPQGPISIVGANTFNAVSITAPATVYWSGTNIISTAFTFAGTASNNAIMLFNPNGNGSLSTLSVASGTATLNWGVIAGMTFSGGATFTATNSYDLQGNSGITITGPSSGGGGHIIGGGL